MVYKRNSGNLLRFFEIDGWERKELLGHGRVIINVVLIKCYYYYYGYHCIFMNNSRFNAFPVAWFGNFSLFLRLRIV